MQKKVAFIGAGNMAEAMVKGLIMSGLLTKDDIVVSDSSAHRLLHMKKNYETHAVPENAVAAKGRDIIILAVKPKDMGKVMKELLPEVQGRAEGKAVSELVKRRLAQSGGASPPR